MPLSGKHYGASVKLVIGFFVCSGQFHLDENLAQLSGGKACADDRAV
jgi:hypothetical protein